MKKLMTKKLNKKGFTLMEMLIVVAIIAVLVAIAIPTFNGALTKAKESADVGNVRAMYAEWQIAILTNNEAIPADTDKFKAGPTDSTGLETLNYPNKMSYTGGVVTYGATKLTDKDGNPITYTWTLGDPTIQ